MTRRLTWIVFVFGLLLVLAGMELLVHPANAANAPAAPVTDDRVLVLLRMPAQHFRAGSDYGGSYVGADREARRRFARDRARANGLTLIDDWPMPMVGLDCFVMQVPAQRSAEEAAAALSHDPGVEWAEPMHSYRAQGSASPAADPLYRAQPVAREWHLDALHKIATGRNVRVAVIDSAIDTHHPDLLGQVIVNENFAPGAPAGGEAHGTGVAGIIAAIAGNGKGIEGVAPDAKLMGLRACVEQSDGATLCDSLSLAKALYFAVEHKADIVNMSLSGPDDMLLGRLIDLALARGATVIGAVDPAVPGGGFPASHPGVVAVSEEGGAAESGFAAPGRDIPTTRPGGDWGFVNGSSFAAAHISGLFALLRQKSRRPQLASALATVQGGNIVDPCATLRRVSSQGGGCESDHALALRTRP